MGDQRTEDRRRYVIGVDFGSLSGRAVLCDVSDGRVVSEAVHTYPHGTMTDHLPDGTKVAALSALQHPGDYLSVLSDTVREVVAAARIRPEQVIGLSLDVTSCTMLPVDEDLRPLCEAMAFRDEPHAYVKLWKHHSAQTQAERVTAVAKDRGEAFLPYLGDMISPEWMLPKILETLEEAPDVYETCDAFLEIGDWLVCRLTGERVIGACAAGYKMMWNPETGYPGEDFLAAVHPGLKDLTRTKLRFPVAGRFARAGYLGAEGARLTGLTSGCAVGCAQVDAHISVPGAAVTDPGEALMIIGTSTCTMLCGTERVAVPGICGCVEDGIYPGSFGYEAGQPGVGDCFDWMVRHFVPAQETAGALSHGKEIHAYLTEEASRLVPGESGLLALDWWNGNRSVLVNSSLSGMILGMTLQTRPPEIYRALIEATAFGMRTILSRLTEYGLPVRTLRACGGISLKNRLLMQIYADVLNRSISVSPVLQTPALGSAMAAAVAAGVEAGGYETITDAVRAMGVKGNLTYTPDSTNVKIYDRLYEQYRICHDYFGKDVRVMETLQQLRGEVSDTRR